MVHAMIMASDQYSGVLDFKNTDIYKRCLAAGIIPASEEDLQQFSNAKKPGTQSSAKSDLVSIPPDREDLLSLSFGISGLWCPACAWVVEETLAKKAGIETVQCNFSSDRGSIVYDPVKISPSKIFKIIEDLGYQADEGFKEGKKINPEFIRLCVCALLAMNTMMLSWAIYSGFFMELSNISVRLLAWPVFIMASIVMVYGGVPIFKKAVAGIRNKTPGMETLISAGSLSSYGYSLFNFFQGSLHLYFDTAAMLIVLILIGKRIEFSAKARITAGFGALFSLIPQKVNLISNEFPKGRYVSVKQLCQGDEFLAEAGETIAADGRVVSGSAVMDESSITGEPEPFNARPESLVKSGSKVVSGKIRVKALQVGSDAVLGKMLAIMESSLSGKTRQGERFEQLLKYFVPGIMAISILTILLSFLNGLTAYEAFNRGISVMVISCPCSLGIAIPLALAAGVSAAGKSGILVRDYEAFEQVEKLNCIVFDKTGTLTLGRMHLLDIKVSPGYSKAQVLALACGLEKENDHYIAQALKTQGNRSDINPLEPKEIVQYSNGISGRLNGTLLRIGSLEFIRKNGGKSPVNPEDQFSWDLEDTLVVTRVFLKVDRELAAEFRFGDAIRPGIRDLVTELKTRYQTVCLVSGDSIQATQKAAELVGLDADQALGQLLPHEKADIVKQFKTKGERVAMVGDGVNDSPAMAVSDLAVAVSSGLEPFQGVAAITLMQETPLQLLDFIALSERVNRKVKQNLGFAFVYNLISIPVAASGLLNPIVAVIAMLLSSLSVTFNTLLLVSQEAGARQKKMG